MNRSVSVSRYRGFTRVNHWVTASCMIVLLISGFSFFHPSPFWMTNLFGGCQMTRWLHPIVGLLLVASFFLLLLQMWKLNLPRREDLEWSLEIGDVLKRNEENLPELVKYNAGQKVVFWGMSRLIVVLVVTGILIWEQYSPTWSRSRCGAPGSRMFATRLAPAAPYDGTRCG
jgi:formate dehydrogenase subunit gamma